MRACYFRKNKKTRRYFFLVGTGGALAPIDLRFLKSSVALARIAFGNRRSSARLALVVKWQRHLHNSGSNPYHFVIIK